MAPSRGYLRKGSGVEPAIGGRRALAEFVVAPALDRAFRSDRARVVVPSGDMGERPLGKGRVHPGVTPTGEGPLGANAAGSSITSRERHEGRVVGVRDELGLPVVAPAAGRLVAGDRAGVGFARGDAPLARAPVAVLAAPRLRADITGVSLP